jgi:16S rRNA (cytidine1402-2'-O)-methyltransferase
MTPSVRPIRAPVSKGSNRAAGSKPPPDAAALAPGLYVVATPIGNAADLSLRALRILAAVDVIACEDTRVTAKLLALHGIERPLSPYHDHNAGTAGPRLLDRLGRGQRVALVADAGTPLVSDPGYQLVRGCIDAGIPVVPVPGASAVLAALTVAGLPTDRFLFAGFLPHKKVARRRAIEELAPIAATLVLLEAPHRLAAALADLADILGPRAAAVARELTKLFEETRRGSLPDLARHYAEAGAPKGEVVLVIEPPPHRPPDEADVDRLLAEALVTLSPRDAVARVAAATGVSRRRLYARALELKAGAGRDR